MAKAPADSIKYNIYAEININGVVEKPDVVGAVFGQSEGLLGEELELRDLQKTGRIGRIEVDLKTKLGKSTGTITIPSSLDMVETSIIAATIESVDRVGPCSASIKVQNIEDARTVKRKEVVDRAKSLLKKLMDEEIPESDRLTDEVKKSVQLSEITTYKGLPAGPGVESADSFIVVEGRADVLTLLRFGIKNAVAVGGTNVPKQLIDLTKQKTTIVFVDGDRGGQIILKELSQVSDIDFVARAPMGKEVEDLSKKEVIMALRRKVPYNQVKGLNNKAGLDEVPTVGKADMEVGIDQMAEEVGGKDKKEKPEPAKKEKEQSPPKKSSGADDKLLSELDSVKGKLNAKLFDKDMNVIAEIEIKDLITSLADVQPTHVVFDGIVTQRLIDAAAKSKVTSIVGVSKSNITNTKGVKVLAEKS